MLHKTRGIVLTHYKFSESSLVVHIFTEMLGMQAYLVNGVWKKNSKFRAVLFQPLMLLDLEVYYKQGKNLQRIKEVVLLEANPNIISDITKSTTALFMAEVFHKTLKIETAEQQLFDFAIAYVRKLETRESNFGLFPVQFLKAYSVVLGISPQEQEKAEDIYFDLMDGSFYEAEPLHPFHLNAEESKLFNKTIVNDLETADRLFRKQERQLMTNKWSEYYFLHFESIREFKSLKVLQEVFE